MRIVGVLVCLIIGARAEPSTELAHFNHVLQLGRELHANGRSEQALPYFDKAARIAESIDPVAHLAAVEWLGIAYTGLRRFAEAERSFIRCLHMLEQLSDPRSERDRHHARVLTSLGGVQLAARRLRDAERRLEQAGQIWRTLPDVRGDPEFVTYLYNVAILNSAQGGYPESARHLREVLALWRNSLASGDRRLVQVMYNLAEVLSRLGLHREADSLSSEALSGFAPKMHQDPLAAAELMSVRSNVLRRAKRRREADKAQAMARDFLLQSGVPYRVDISLLRRD